MFKTSSTSTLVLPRRLRFLNSVPGRFENSPAVSAAKQTAPASSVAAAAMTTDATISARPQQPMLASQREQKRRSEESQEAQANNMSSYFPLTLKDAAHQWWTFTSPRATERSLLSYIPYLRDGTPEASALQEVAKTDPFGHRIWRTQMVQLSGKNRALNEFSVERVGEPVDDTLVMLHGYGAGLGFFYKNFEPLSRVPGWRLYALDMLGMGNSTRPTFRIRAKDQQGKTREAENWFIDALEEWRKVRNIDKFTLLGHSLGGYLAVSYALKYPGHLNKLILASPVGIPEDPWAASETMPEPEESAMEAEFTQDQESIVSTKATPRPRRPIPGWVAWLWDANVSPFSFVRLAGPVGPRLVSAWTSRRFNHLPNEEAHVLHMYSFSVFRQRGSGEYALPHILAPGAYARSPVINRIQNVGRQVITPATETEPAVRETGFPIIFMYGDHDWMDVAGGYASEEKIKARVVQALLTGSDEEKRRENGSAKVVIVSKAGHHLYIDNADEFNDFVKKELEKTREEGIRQRRMAGQ